jgi:hypothetical protein
MIPLRFVIVDYTTKDDATDEPLFWSNEDGWVSLDTPSVLMATATETGTLSLPMGGNVEWMSYAKARKMVDNCR